MRLTKKGIIYHRWMKDFIANHNKTLKVTPEEMKLNLTAEQAYAARHKHNLRFRKAFIKTKEDMEKGLGEIERYYMKKHTREVKALKISKKETEAKLDITEAELI